MNNFHAYWAHPFSSVITKDPVFWNSTILSGCTHDEVNGNRWAYRNGWYLKPTGKDNEYNISNDTGHCLRSTDDFGKSIDNCSTNLNQKFIITPLNGHGQYRIKSKHTGKCLSVKSTYADCDLEDRGQAFTFHDAREQKLNSIIAD